MRRGGVHLLGQGAEGYPFLLQGGHNMEKMRQGPAEPIQFPHNQTIARTHIREGVLQSWPVITSAAGLVGKEMSRIDAGALYARKVLYPLDALIRTTVARYLAGSPEAGRTRALLRAKRSVRSSCAAPSQDSR